MNNEIKYEYKKINVSAGFTDDSRKAKLEKLEAIMAKDGWILEEYFNGGLTKSSEATFKRDLKYKSMKPKVSIGKVIKNTLITGVIFIIILAIIGVNSENNETEQEVKKDNFYYKKYENKILKDMKKESSEELNKIAISYAEEKNINKDYYKTIGDCLGDYVHNKSEILTIGTMLQWCNDDYNNEYKKAVYYNKAWLFEDFSSWNGSYRPLEGIIKASMNDVDSYKHIETTYSFILYGDKVKRPYMQVNTIFSGKNAFGGVVKQEITAKVDAKTKELFDIE